MKENAHHEPGYEIDNIKSLVDKFPLREKRPPSGRQTIARENIQEKARYIFYAAHGDRQQQDIPEEVFPGQKISHRNNNVKLNLCPYCPIAPADPGEISVRHKTPDPRIDECY